MVNMEPVGTIDGSSLAKAAPDGGDGVEKRYEQNGAGEGQGNRGSGTARADKGKNGEHKAEELASAVAHEDFRLWKGT